MRRKTLITRVATDKAAVNRLERSLTAAQLAMMVGAAVLLGLIAAKAEAYLGSDEFWTVFNLPFTQGPLIAADEAGEPADIRTHDISDVLITSALLSG